MATHAAWAYAGAAHPDQKAATNPTSMQSAAENARRLTAGQSVRREIDAGAIHYYQIELSSGQFLRLLAKAQDINIAIIIWSPNRRKIHELRNRCFEPTPLSLISDMAGAYTLEVQSLESNGYKGHYELEVAQLRPAVAHDKNSVTAERLIANADRQRKEWNMKSFLQSINQYEEARKYLRGISVDREEIYLLKSTGEVYAMLGQNAKALEYFNKALHLDKTIEGKQLEIELLNDIASINIDLGEKTRALEDCERAQSLSKQIGFIQGEAQAVNNLGGLFSYILGEKLKAIDLFGQALKLWQTAGDRHGQAQSLVDLGITHVDLGNTRKAISYFGQALRLWQAVKDRRGEAQTLTVMGLAHASLGEMQQAIEEHNKASRLFSMMGDTIGKAITLNGMAYVYANLGEKHHALELYKKAVQLYQTTGRRAGEAVTLGLIGEIYEELGEKQKALDYHYRKLEISRSIGLRRAEAYTLRDIGMALDSLGNLDKALEYYDEALALSQRLHDLRGEAYALNSIGYVYDRRGQKQKAVDLYKRALGLLRAAEDRAGEALTLHNIARVVRDLGDLAESFNECKALLSIIENVRVKVANQELRASYFASAHHHYELCIDILMRMRKQNSNEGYSAAALEASEKARGRSLLDLLNEARAEIRQGVDPALLAQEYELQHLLNSKAERQVRMLSEAHTEEQKSAMEAEIANLTRQYEEVLANIRSNSPRYAALTQAKTLNLQEIQQQILDEGSILLEYSLGDERSYLWAVTPSSATAFELPGRARIEDAAERLYRSLTASAQPSKNLSARDKRLLIENARSQFSDTAKELSRILLGPVVSELGAKRLIIVADGALQYIPFAVLPDPAATEKDQEPLIVNHEIVSLPSVSILSMLRKELQERSPASKALAVLADPVYEKDDPRVVSRGVRVKRRSGVTPPGSVTDQTQQPLRSLAQLENEDEVLRFQRLPSSWIEATTITSFIPESDRKLALGFEANIATATSAGLRQYQIVHFATHALIYGEHPQLYGIVLSLFNEQGKPQDGFLRLNEIYNLKLPVELVVLSACQTAVGKEIKGEGLVGLTRGFMYAGAARIVATLWKVDDKASAVLMKHFYEAMFVRRLRPAAALRDAQIAMWKDARWKFPYYWGAFLLQGEWR